MKKSFIYGRNQKLTSFILLAIFIYLGIHFHEPHSLTHFHFHNLNLSEINQASSNFLTDGHICPCFIAALDMPAINGLFVATLNETNLFGFTSFHLALSLTWEIFHPPQTI